MALNDDALARLEAKLDHVTRGQRLIIRLINCHGQLAMTQPDHPEFQATALRLAEEREKIRAWELSDPAMG